MSKILPRYVKRAKEAEGGENVNDQMTAEYYNYLKGDENALARIIEMNSDSLLYFVCPIVRDIGTAEEIVSDSFVQIAVKRRSFRGDSSLKTYLYAIARNRAVDYVRKMARRGEILCENDETLADTATLEGMILKSERDRHLHSAMAELCEDYRTVLHLVYFEGMNASQAAEVMKKNKKQTDNLLYRAKLALKSILEKDGYGYENI